MKSSLIITDVTRMREPGVCIAGYTRDCRCVRPVLPIGQLSETWLYSDRRVVVRPFAVVQFDLVEPKSDPPHTEDWIIEPAYRAWQGLLTPDESKSLLDKLVDSDIQSIFGAEIRHGPGTYIMHGTGSRSLGTIRPSAVQDVLYEYRWSEDRWDFRLAFTDQAGNPYKLAVTDLTFRYYLTSLRVRNHLAPAKAAQTLAETLQKTDVYLRIGLARPTWQKFLDRCYLQITGVYSFPDYLCGGCFADFALSEQESETDKRSMQNLRGKLF